MINTRAKSDWDQLLHFPELTQYLNIKNLKELSITNKCLRNKLKPFLFKSICLNGGNFVNYFDYSKESDSFKYTVDELLNYMNTEDLWDYDRLRLKDLNIEPVLKSLELSLLGINNYVRRAKFYNLKAFGYFAFPLAYNFSDIIKLEISQCSIPLIRLVKLGENLINLTVLILNSVTFIYNKEGIIFDKVIIPKNLKTLAIYNCNVRKFASTVNMFSICQNLSYRFRNFELLKPINILNLNQFKFCNQSTSSNLLIKFLKFNPQIKALELDKVYNSQDILNCLASECSNILELKILKHLNISSTNLSIPIFNNITNLNLSEFYEDTHLGALICKNCPNLTYLTLNFAGCNINNTIFNRLLVTTVSTLNRLKTLEILVKGLDLNTMCFRKLNTLQFLIIKSYNSSMLSVNSDKLPSQLYCIIVECMNTGKLFKINKSY